MLLWKSAIIFIVLIIGASIQITTSSHVISTSSLSIKNNVETNEITSRIVGGVEAQIGDFIGIVSIQNIYSGHFCVGTLVALDAVVTAAHCLISGAELSMPIEDIIIIGDDLSMFWPSEDRQERFVIDITPHPDYNANTNANDVAVILLSQPFVSTTTFDIVVMPFNKPIDNTLCSVAGWGYTNFETQGFSEKLLKTDIIIVNQDTCNSTYRYTVPINTICAGDAIRAKGYCQGDTGAGLICGNRLVGIALYIDNCGIPGNPGIYTDVTIFRIWIYQVIARGPLTTTTATTTTTSITSPVSDTSDPPIITTTESSSITTSTPLSITTPTESSITTPIVSSITTPIFESSSITTPAESSPITTTTSESSAITATTESSPSTTISPAPIATTVDPNHATSFTTSFLVVILIATVAQHLN